MKQINIDPMRPIRISYTEVADSIGWVVKVQEVIMYTIMIRKTPEANPCRFKGNDNSKEKHSS
jgi:hypothetical protein